MSKRKETANETVVIASKPITTALSDELTPKELAPETEENKSENVEVKTEAEKPEVEEQAEDTVYLGPDIKDININHGKVFKNGTLPNFLAERIKEVPAIKGLIVPVSRYAEVARAVTLPDGTYSMLYKLAYKAVKDR